MGLLLVPQDGTAGLPGSGGGVLEMPHLVRTRSVGGVLQSPQTGLQHRDQCWELVHETGIQKGLAVAATGPVFTLRGFSFRGKRPSTEAAAEPCQGDPSPGLRGRPEPPCTPATSLSQ